VPTTTAVILPAATALSIFQLQKPIAASMAGESRQK
jgi:hypothetical protein